MVTILFRTVFIYIMLICAMRLMGKRQLGELELSELITTLLLSEIAALPITNQDIPLLFAIVPIITLMVIEVFLSTALLHFPIIGKVLTIRPALLIYHGQIIIPALRRTRVSLDELVCSLRQKSVTSIKDVEYAILEQNGQISVITSQDSAGSPLMYIIVADGKIQKNGLNIIKKDESWLTDQLNMRKQPLKSVFCMMADEQGNIYLQRK